jgi:ribosomal protein L34E
MERRSPETKKCSKCGAAFECAHDAQCWCMDYIISPENIEKLKASYDNCLCKDCLSEYSSGRRSK